MSSEYEIWLASDEGTRIALLSDWISFRAQWYANGVGSLELTLPVERRTQFLSAGVPGRDMRIYVWRAVDGGNFALLFETFWLVRKYQRDQDARLLTVYGQTANTLLRRRIVANRPGSDEAAKYGPADDLIHEVVSEQFTDAGLLNISERDWSSVLDFGTSASGGETVRRSFAYKGVWDVCVSLCEDSWEKGTWLGFDVIADATSPYTGNPTLNTYPGQRGRDRTASVVLSRLRGNIDQIADTIDYENETTVAYIGGPGEGRYRQVEAVSIDALITEQFGLIEDFKSATQQSGIVAVANEAFALLREQRATTTLACRVLDVPGSRYGVDIFPGDLVTYYESEDGTTYTGRVNSVSISADSDGEQVELDMELEQT
jgi:hypothetical protein